MDGDVEDIWVVVEYLLSAISMVNVLQKHGKGWHLQKQVKGSQMQKQYIDVS